MARKWSNLNLPGALHFVTGNCLNRLPLFTEPACCKAFLEQLETLNQNWPAKLIAYVLMPDHFHFISNPRDGRIIEFCRDLKSKAAKAIVKASRRFRFPETVEGHQVWQESFKARPLWSGWMINQKIHYIHANPVKARLVNSARDYYWSSFRSFYTQGDEPLAVDHDWWWPDDVEKLSKAMKELGWLSFWKREGEEGDRQIRIQTRQIESTTLDKEQVGKGASAARPAESVARFSRMRSLVPTLHERYDALRALCGGALRLPPSPLVLAREPPSSIDTPVMSYFLPAC